MTQFQILCKLVPRHSYTPGNLYPEGKNCAVSVLHRDYFVAKDEAPCPALRQVTPTNFIAGPLGFSLRPSCYRIQKRRLGHQRKKPEKKFNDRQYTPIL